MNLKFKKIIINKDVIATSCNHEIHYCKTKTLDGDFFLTVELSSPEYKYWNTNTPITDPSNQQKDEITEIVKIDGRNRDDLKIINLYYYENGHYYLCDGVHKFKSDDKK